MEIIPCSVSMSSRLVLSSSFPSAPVSAKIVKIVAYFWDALFTISSTFSVVGIIGVFSSTL